MDQTVAGNKAEIKTASNPLFIILDLYFGINWTKSAAAREEQVQTV